MRCHLTTKHYLPRWYWKRLEQNGWRVKFDLDLFIFSFILIIFFFQFHPSKLNCLIIDLYNFIQFTFDRVISVSQPSHKFYMLIQMGSGQVFLTLFFNYIFFFNFVHHYFICLKLSFNFFYYYLYRVITFSFNFYFVIK